MTSCKVRSKERVQYQLLAKPILHDLQLNKVFTSNA